MRLSIFILFCSFLLVFSCNNIEKIKKSTDYEYKLTKANEFYSSGKWENANVLYEELLAVFKGTKIFEEIYYRYAMSFYKQRQYLAASYHFKNFSDIFPNSDSNEELEYLNTLCLQNLSPKYTLDQSSTTKSIQEIQKFIDKHPTSKHVREANKQMDASREKLEIKDAYAAETYFKIGQHKAAALSFNQLLNKYPDSSIRDYYLYYAIKSQFKYATRSIEEKQKERFEQVLTNSKDFLANYSKSKYRNDVERYKTLSLQSIKKLK